MVGLPSEFLQTLPLSFGTTEVSSLAFAEKFRFLYCGCRVNRARKNFDAAGKTVDPDDDPFGSELDITEKMRRLRKQPPQPPVPRNQEQTDKRDVDEGEEAFTLGGLSSTLLRSTSGCW